MRTRVVVLRIIVALLTFLIGVTAAIIIGHINPFARASRHCAVEYRLEAYPPSDMQEGFHYCPHMSTADLKYKSHLGRTPDEIAPVELDAPDAPPPPPAPTAPRLSHRR